MKNQKKILVRITTVPLSLNILLRGQLRFLNDYFEVIAVSGPGSDLEEVERREGVAVKPLKFKRDISILYDIRSLIHLYLLFHKLKPSIVHSNTPKASLLSMIAAWAFGVPHRIYSVTGLRFEGETGFKKKLLIFMEKLTCAFATKVFPEGRGIMKLLELNHITGKELKVIHNGNINGIDTAFYNPELFSESQKENLRSGLNINKTDTAFLYVGRLVADKGINELAGAFTRLNNLHNNVKLILVGPLEADLDPLKPDTLKLINNNPNIKAVGYQKDVRIYYAISDIFVFPSYREGFPNVVLQAGAMNLPSIVTDICGSNEIIFDGVNGIIIPRKDESALFEAMLKIYKDESVRLLMRQGTRKIIKEKYESSDVWMALLREYQSLE